MPTFDLDTSEKVVSLLAGLLAIWGALVIKKRRDSSGRQSQSQQQTIGAGQATQATQSQNQNQSGNGTQSQSQNQHLSVNIHSGQTTDDKKTVAELKATSSILFIDDDKKFKIDAILRRMGWQNTKLIKDINSLDDPNVINADVLFIDIQGVGNLLQLKEEGLGLALALKKRHPKKKVVVYSAQEEGQRFHESLAEADYFLPKTAEPIRFEEVIIKVLTK